MNLATHFDRSKRDFNFLRGLPPVLLDGFSIGWHEEKRETFDLFAAKFESGAKRFSGKKSLRRRSPFKTRIPPKEQDPFAQLFQHFWGHARSLRMDYKDL